jgi:hypothetical protein
VIIVELFGGLGNTMFQYAAGKIIEKETGIKVKFDISFFLKNYSEEGIKKRYYNQSIGLFLKEIIVDSDSLITPPSFQQKLFSSSCLLVRKTSQKLLNYHKEVCFTRDILDVSKDNMQLSGYWQNYKLMSRDVNYVKSLFQFPKLDKYNNNILNEINQCNSVFCHIRRGDYVNIKSSNNHNVTTKDYFYKAMKYMVNKISNPVFFVFTDDIDWVQNNFQENSFKLDMRVVSINNCRSAFNDMYLMSQCDHAIISNSSFSWWGAFLQNKNNIVITPSKWLNSDRGSQINSIIGNHWVKLN